MKQLDQTISDRTEHYRLHSTEEEPGNKAILQRALV
ncbi:hypothetical protein NBRC3278_3083 [Acetobacter pasteurianus NBRC 3278]|uniref:Uncharacterized protein n=2 Tax=Acetobacter pasteurianus TaxID=438 RepID=A0A401WYL2_ACEPA|nr:hypothetical protein NBRC3188_3052 [Acetobacter pasteurianus NBRC 3188]GCD60427.1 hypothetical protein NBRC3277_3002 [Acetobacter pasteurianus NBRC 3277]GCD63990.1 hypothetical protein NBRC3278_3083 [Acetobacter pasteurianus NBRC 3278]GCD67152.1 hypothetical protein NBRC3279_2643 [Acetobacter pasteurianus NBRC 3279]GCD73464.1 hypothetical protein NBRC3284_2620 [Acetobacter pasteurianus NBRC 3284]